MGAVEGPRGEVLVEDGPGPFQYPRVLVRSFPTGLHPDSVLLPYYTRLNK